MSKALPLAACIVFDFIFHSCPSPPTMIGVGEGKEKKKTKGIGHVDLVGCQIRYMMQYRCRGGRGMRLETRDHILEAGGSTCCCCSEKGLWYCCILKIILFFFVSSLSRLSLVLLPFLIIPLWVSYSREACWSVGINFNTKEER